MDDPYKTLGLPRDASADDIRKAYRKLAKQHHPDLNPGNAAAEARFKDVAAANALLSDTESRARFDRGEIDAEGQPKPPPGAYRDYADHEPGRRYARPGASQAGASQAGASQRGGAQAGGGWSAEDLSDIFGGMFNAGRQGGFGGAGEERAIRGQDEHYTLAATFLDAVLGATPRLTLPDGRTLDVKLPPGTADGQILRLRNQGGGGWNGGPNGDALIEIRVQPHKLFRRDGQDIRLDLPVTLQEAVLGGPVEIATPAGPVRMRIPAGSDTGTELRLRGRGVPAHGSQPAGDLYATLRVVLGKPDPALQAFLAEWKPAEPFNPRPPMETEA